MAVFRGAGPLAFPLFGPACAAALLAGVTACLLLPALPPRWLLGLLLVAAIPLLRAPRLRPIGMLLAGLAFAGWQAGAVLDAQLPRALQGTVLTVEGRIVELPVHEPRRTRFRFVVDDVATQPVALRGRTLQLAWYGEELQPRQRLQAGSRWRFPLRLRAPRGLRNPGGATRRSSRWRRGWLLPASCWSRRWPSGWRRRPASMPGAKP